MNEEIFKLLDREALVLAPIQKRVMAMIIDNLILAFIGFFILYDKLINLGTYEEMILVIQSYTFYTISLEVIYHTFFIYLYGATFGKIVMKIRVIEIYRVSTPSLPVAINRAVFRIISGLFFYAGFIWGLLDPARQTWHDKTAKTVVVDV